MGQLGGPYKFKTLAAVSEWNPGDWRHVSRMDWLTKSKTYKWHLYPWTARILGWHHLPCHSPRHLHEIEVVGDFYMPPSTSQVSDPSEEPELHLSAEEKQHHLTKGLCLYWSGQGHVVTLCPIKATTTSKQRRPGRWHHYLLIFWYLHFLSCQW